MNMLIELFRLPHFLREGYLYHFLRLLDRRAVVMIKYADTKLDHSADILESSALKKMRQDLELTSDADFFLLLGVAERLSPGIYFALAGDPATIEEKFIELFESF